MLKIRNVTNIKWKTTPDGELIVESTYQTDFGYLFKLRKRGTSAMTVIQISRERDDREGNWYIVYKDSKQVGVVEGSRLQTMYGTLHIFERIYKL